MIMLLGEAYVIEYWELRPKGRTVLSALIQCISGDRSWLWGQCSRGSVGLDAVSSGAEVAVDGPGALPLLLCCRSMVAKAI